MGQTQIVCPICLSNSFMKRKVLFLFFCLYSVILSAQVKHDYNWILGYDANPDTLEGEGTIFDFNNSSVTINFLPLEINIEQTNTTMSNTDGDLLFYSNGCSIYNADHELMENGDSINPGQVHDIQCHDAYTVLQGMIALPLSDNDSLYYIFHQHIIYETNPFDVKIDQLMYSIVNLNYNNGLGKVIEKNSTAIPDTLWPGELSAVKHDDGENWWIMSPRFLQNKYYTMLLTSDSLTSPSEQTIGATVTRSGEGSGQACFSPDGTKYARYNKTDQVYLFDFDRSTGQLSNFQHLMVADTAYSGGLAFSPGSQYLYISSSVYAYQFDLWASDIQGSKKLVATWDGFKEHDFFATTFALMQLGPDCRIYISTGPSTTFFHVIHHPDLEGEACDLEQRAVKLPSYSFHAMPHFPNYRLGTTPTYPCDPTIDLPVSTKEQALTRANFNVYPNPASNLVTISYGDILSANVEWVLYTSVGQAVKQVTLEKGSNSTEVSLADLPKGLYFYSVTVAGEVLESGKLVVAE